MAQGSTGFSKQEIDALLSVMGHLDPDHPSVPAHMRQAYWVAYDKLCRVQERLS